MEQWHKSTWIRKHNQQKPNHLCGHMVSSVLFRPIAIQTGLNIFTWIIKPTSNYNSWLTGVTNTLFTEWPIPILSYTNRLSMVYSSWIMLNMTAFASIKQRNNKTNQQHSRHSITADTAQFRLVCVVAISLIPFMENYCWAKLAIMHDTGHVSTKFDDSTYPWVNG